MRTLNAICEALDSIGANQQEETIQRCAWKLVRAAQDRLGADRGKEKRDWCIERLVDQWSGLSEQDAEDFVRAAYFNFKLERGSS